MAQKILVASLDLDVDKVIKSSSQYLKQINQLKAAQKELKDTGQGTSRTFVENDAALKNLNKSYRDSQKFASSLLAVNENLEKTMSSENKTVQELYDSRRQLNEISKNITGDTKEEIDLRNKLNNAIDAQTKELRSQQSEFNSSKDKVGEYSQAIEQALGSNTLLGRTFGAVKEGLGAVKPLYSAFVGVIREGASQIFNATKNTEGLTNSQKAQAIATNVASGALKVFKGALAATGIGAIVLVLGSLISFLTGTQKGIDAVTSVTRPLTFVFEKMLGILQQLGSTLFDAFSNPKQTIKSLGESIKQNIINRLEAVGKVGRALGTIISSGFTEGFDELSDAVLQGATGVENFASKAKTAFGSLSNQMKGAVKDGQEYDALLKKIEREEIKQIERQSKLSLEAKKANLIAEDTTKSLGDREAAAIRARNIQLELIEGEKGLNNLRVQAIELQNKQNDTTNASKKELAELQAANRAFEESRIEARTTFNNKLNTIRAERQSRLDKEAATDAERQEKITLEEEKENSKRLEAVREFEERKKAIQNEIALQTATEGEERRLLKIEIETEQRQSDIENLVLNAEQERELLVLLEEEKQLAINTIKEELENEAFQKSVALQEKALEAKRQGAAEEVKITKQLTGLLIGLLGDSLGAKLAGIAIEAAAQAGLVTIQTASAQAQNIAQATAAAPPPFNIGLIATAIGQNAGMAATSAAAISKIVGSAAIQGLGAVTSKFADGGILRGPSHAQGGIKTPYGEVEGNEIILTKGVTSNPYLKAMASTLNVAGGGKKFQNGGVFGSGSSMVQGRFSSGGSGSANPFSINYEMLSSMLADKVNNVKVAVPVDTITGIQNQVEAVETGANV